MAAFGENDYASTFQNLDKAKEFDSSLPEIDHPPGTHFLPKKEMERALYFAKKSIELKPDYSDANNTVGKFLLDMGRSEEAVPYLQKAAGDVKYQDAYKPLTNLGILYYRKGDFEQSKNHFKKAALTDANRSCVASYYLGHLSMRTGKLQDAVQNYDRATRRFCGAFADAHLALGIAYQRGKQFDLARKKFLDLKQRFPETSVAEQAMKHLRELP